MVCLGELGNNKLYLRHIGRQRRLRAAKRSARLRQRHLGGGHPLSSGHIDGIGYKNMGVAQGGIIDTPDGDWIAVANADFGTAGVVRFTARIAARDGGEIEIHLDSAQGEISVRWVQAQSMAENSGISVRVI